MRVTKDFLRGRGDSLLGEEERELLEEAVECVRDIPPRIPVTERGERVTCSMLLLDGLICRYMDARDGYRQLVAMQVPGDFIDLHGYPLHRLDHHVATLTAVRVAIIPHVRIDAIIAGNPHLARLLWRSTLLDAALHREWIFRIGRLDGMGRIAHFLLETFYRLRAVGRVDGDTFDLPLTQQDLGEACGLTSVHVNRVLRRLREDGLVEMGRGKVRLCDRGRLATLGEFNPDYLYLEDDPRAGHG